MSTDVVCLLEKNFDQKILPASCLARQVDDECFCPQGAVALERAPEPSLLPKRVLLPVLRARANRIMLMPEGRRYLGVALQAKVREHERALDPPKVPPMNMLPDPKIRAYPKCPKCTRSTPPGAMRYHLQYQDGKVTLCSVCRLEIDRAVLTTVPPGAIFDEVAEMPRPEPKEKPPRAIVDEAILPPPRELDNEYLIECVKEAKRRMDSFGEAFDYKA